MATRTAPRLYALTIVVTGNVLRLRGTNPRSGTTQAEGERLYLWDPDQQARLDHREERDIVRLSSFESDDEDDRNGEWFVFYTEDSMSPSLHGIHARNFERAYEIFVEQEAERGHYVLDENDPEFDPEGDHQEWVHLGGTQGGVTVHTETFRGFAVEFHSIEHVPVHVVENPARRRRRR